MTKREKRYHHRKKVLRQRMAMVVQTENRVHWAELVNMIEADDDTDLEECLNCGSLWSVGTEEYDWQQCSACGWQPGEPIVDDDDDDDDDDFPMGSDDY
jgi:predicted nucleic acid-binding Zn ribbon protein